ncbi:MULTISPECIES: MarR family winged helix-turn-helix transcriptional regulator [unclassified Flavobacterium]|uniref:MarR family winged helix-turn-helix transcriptional regulator n=1 Tax=unclassified Flavobacterium TaxID=196869 RepID=UPI000EAEFA7E|nr:MULTISPECIES: MarR family transcriptional regulator [unclassified Flavobacterium]RKS01033.1 DNA-binding MarR family transcriptional regulator [Flavobacterium sp. 102]
MENLSSVIFYNIEEAIKTYRMYAQNQLKINDLKITIDQWLVLKCLKENPNATQIELAEKVFKDNASITRIVELLVKANFLQREINQNDRRKMNLKITSSGEKILEDVYKIVLKNRAKALEGITAEEIESVNSILKKISSNCKK